MEEINASYEREGPNLKLGALFMPHYMETNKLVLRNFYQNTVGSIKQEAFASGKGTDKIIHFAHTPLPA